MIVPPGFHTLAIGDAAPDFSLPGVDGKTYRLSDFKDAPYLMVVFLSNHCPVSHAAQTRLLPLVAQTRGRGLMIVAINPNNPAGLQIDELGYTKYDDTLEGMKGYARESGFTFPYLYDGDTQATARRTAVSAPLTSSSSIRSAISAMPDAMTIPRCRIPPRFIQATRPMP